MRITIELYDHTRVRARGRAVQRLFTMPLGRRHTTAPPVAGPGGRRLLQTARKAMIAAAFVAVVLVLLGAQSTRLTRRPAGEGRERVASRVRECLRLEVAFARPGATPGELRAAVGSVERLILRRGGVAIDAASAERLAAMEGLALRDGAKRLSLDDLAAVAATTLLERVRDSEDAEISYAADVFGNIARRPDDAAPGEVARAIAASKIEWRRARARAALGAEAKPSPDRIVMLRYTGAGTMSTEEFVDRARQARARLRLPHGYALAIGATERVARNMLASRLDLFRDADPERWERAGREGLTPLEALLLVYSVASDDRLIFTTDEMRSKIREELRAASAGEAEMAAGECAPFGPYGQRFSTPLDLALEPKTLARLLDRVEERISR